MAVYQKVFPFISLKTSIVMITIGSGALYLSIQAPNQLLILTGGVWDFIYATIFFLGVVLAFEAYEEKIVKSFLFKQRFLTATIEQLSPVYSWQEELKLKLFKAGLSKKDALFIGKGFLWKQQHVQTLYDLDLDTELKEKIEELGKSKHGSPVYQAIGQHQEESIYLEYSSLPGHVGVEGTTRVGKSRVLENIACQQIQLRNGAVIVIDPKGDMKLADVLYDTCKKTGNPNRFKMFSLVHDLGTINPIMQYDEPSDVANRLIRLVSGDGQEDGFINFSLGELISVCEAMDYIGIPMTIKDIHRFLTLEEVKKDYSNRARQLSVKDGSSRGKAVVETLNRIIAHPGEHYKKMVAAITPTLEQLSSGSMERLLCSTNPSISFEKDVENDSVILFSLASMVNKKRAEQVAKIILEDLTSYLGRCYAYKNPDDFKDIYMHADEIGDYLVPAYVNLLNKGGGAKFKSWNYFQTEEDFVVALNDSQASADKALGNLNTRIWLRTLSKMGIRNLVDDSPMTKIIMTQETTTRNAKPDDPNILFTAGVSSRTTPEEVPLVDGRWLKRLPVGEGFMFTEGKYYKVRFPLVDDPENSYLREQGLTDKSSSEYIKEDANIVAVN